MKITVTSAGAPTITLEKARNGWVKHTQGDAPIIYPLAADFTPLLFVTKDDRWKLVLRTRTLDVVC